MGLQSDTYLCLCQNSSLPKTPFLPIVSIPSTKSTNFSFQFPFDLGIAGT